MSYTVKPTKLLLVAGVVIAALLAVSGARAGGSAAQEPSLFLVHYTDHQELLLPADECVPFPMRYTYDAWGTFHGVTHGDSPHYGADNFNQVEVFTNLENGKTFSVVAHGVDKDLHIIDNGTGLLTIEALEAGPVNYYGPDGRPLFREAGLFTFTVVIDTKGTPMDPSDDEMLSKTPTGYWGIDQAAGRDFCADLVTYIG